MALSHSEARRLEIAKNLLANSIQPNADETLAQAYLRKSLSMMADRLFFIAGCVVAGAFDEPGDIDVCIATTSPSKPEYARELIHVMASFCGWFDAHEPARSAQDLLRRATAEDPARHFLKVNTYGGVLWYDRERYGDFVFWTYLLALLDNGDTTASSGSRPASVKCDSLFEAVGMFFEARNRSAYRVDRLLAWFGA